ncbi:SagB/ThcOx family dehydrogenase [Pseudomonas cichorii]|uniref:SagB/ThcOx family dehydrogenase n=1 Tax=Pseudomonas cichorii TaxID=36746 RepID=UPI001C8A2E0E|nr:SagB/ThcOx family dehydrogenase [Pseudomonas cichorii]MBX8486541.1 SagB/ThcOx family dehydrogenase [Pseudomonas cichorii]MBX8496643.1 SagB/ThcOx family dehydrogenase [Pseudomonas cichorii]MBX8513939.1 SagB/ThcOx family dehydrogenase [Pseudomonas cichorii]MBX8576116.1 SagB/ThcOx family dehydrogenase [Pseudomonas cichorii]
MSTLPHDYYLRFLDKKVFDEISTFHNRTNFTLHEAVENITHLHNLSEHTLKELTGNELQLYPDMDLTLKEHSIPSLNKENPLSRNESCEYFTEQELSFETIKNLISPLMRKKAHAHKRGYPSGGALYPVEIFLCSLSEKNTGWPCAEKVIHLLPNSRTFEVIQETSDIGTLKKAILPKSAKIGTPNLALIYTTYIPKTIFKYRYRGYRLAHLETGSLYMLVDLMCSHLKLQSRVWSGYYDHMICKSIGLNPTFFYPLCTHLIGGTHE